MFYNKVSYYDVDYMDFEKYVCKIFNLDDWSFIADEECSNDSVHDFYIEKEDDFGIETSEREKFKQFLENKGIRHTYNILTFLCNQDIIPEGKYLIHVSW